MKKTTRLFWGTSMLLAVASIMLLMMADKSNPDSAANTRADADRALLQPISAPGTGKQEDLLLNTIPAPEETDETFSIASLKRLLFPSDDPAWAWSKVDMDRLQQELPDNLYWQLAAPTTDAFVLEERKDIKRHWEQEYGQILSNKATEEQIRAYYAHQHQVSTDYVIFATKLLDRHGQDLPERDFSFQTLARNLHLARLEEIPRQLSRALELKTAHEQRKKEWLADKEAFEANLRIEREQALRELRTL